ncbi:MAG: 16S rRNA processing protein RimM [Anaerolineaceae bacterium 4572_78]|nr:MAG: 16S rRNA processing protein RimM [Anaerolineaceae bacterium 4572_78]
MKLLNAISKIPYSTNSPPPFLAIGQITKPHGIHGEMVVNVLTDFPERFETMKSVQVGTVDSVTDYVVTKTRWHKNRILITFAEIQTRKEAEMLRGLYLQIPTKSAKELSDDTYYEYQLIGLTVITDMGKVLGTLAEIVETGANDVYIVKNNHQEILLPATYEVILSVDLTVGKMIVHLLDGLI